MKYSTEVRMKNVGPTKFLICSDDHSSFMEAFHDAKDKANKVDEDHFVQIVDNDKKEVVAFFPNKCSA